MPKARKAPKAPKAPKARTATATTAADTVLDVHDDTTQLSQHLREFVRAVQNDVDMYLAQMADHVDNPGDVPAPTFKTGRKTSPIEITPGVNLIKAASKVCLEHWTFHVYTAPLPNGNRKMWIQYYYVPGRGGVYQALPVFMAN
jgi:hypothetical protein